MPENIRRFERAIFRILPHPWQKRLRAWHASHISVARGVFWVACFVLAAKTMALLKELAVAYRFGTSAVLEGYLLAFNLAGWPVSLSLAVFQLALVPELVRVQQASSDGGRRWQRQVTAWVWCCALLLGLIVAQVLPPLIREGWLGLDSEGRQAALDTMPYLAAMTVLGVVAAWCACQLMSRQRHANTLLEAAPAVGILCAVLVVSDPVVDSLLWGTISGFALQLALLMTLLRNAGLPVAPKIYLAQPFDESLRARFSIVLAAQVALGVGNIIDLIVLAHLPQGELASFGYAGRVMALVLTLSVTVSGRALLPVLARLSGSESYAVANRWSWVFFWLGVAGVLILSWTAEPLVALLFERGAFSEQDTASAAELLRWMSLQLPFQLIGSVWLQWILTLPNTHKRVWWAVVFSLLAKWVTMVLLLEWFNWAANGVIAGMVAGAVAYAAVLHHFVSQHASSLNKVG